MFTPFKLTLVNTIMFFTLVTQLLCDVIFLVTHGCFQKTLGLELPGQVRSGRFTLIGHLSLLRECSNLLIQAGCDYSSLLTLVEAMVSFASWEFF